jgi:hypothetical protein
MINLVAESENSVDGDGAEGGGHGGHGSSGKGLARAADDF